MLGKGIEWIDRSLIDGPYTCLCITEKDFQSQLKRLKVPASQWPAWISPSGDATTHIMANQENKLCALICIEPDKKQDPNSIVGLLIHEAVHVWQAFCDEIGEDEPSSEFEAYAIQSISQRIIMAYSTLTAKPKKKKKDTVKDGN